MRERGRGVANALLLCAIRAWGGRVEALRRVRGGRVDAALRSQARAAPRGGREALGATGAERHGRSAGLTEVDYWRLDSTGVALGSLLETCDVPNSARLAL